MIWLCVKIVADTDLYKTDEEVQNLIGWVCLSEQKKENNKCRAWRLLCSIFLWKMKRESYIIKFTNWNLYGMKTEELTPYVWLVSNIKER